VRGRIDDSDKGRVVLAEEVKPLDEATIAGARAAGNGGATHRGGPDADRNGPDNGAPGGWRVDEGAHACRIRLRAAAAGPGEALAELRSICEAHPGSTPLFVHLLLGDQEVVMRAKGMSVSPEPALVAKVESLLGPGSILVEYAGRA
jgi:hypothetical protein